MRGGSSRRKVGWAAHAMGSPSLAWLPLSSLCQPESSLRLTTAWWALQTSPYHLSTYGSFWICHFSFLVLLYLVHLMGFSFGQDSYKKTANTQMPHKALIVRRSTEAWASYLPFWGQFLIFYIKKSGALRTPRHGLLFLVFLCRGKPGESFHTPGIQGASYHLKR